MKLSWSARRQLIYYVVAIVIGAVVVYAGWLLFFTHTPTCFDGIQNGSELGVDCGGSCSLLCKNQTRSPIVAWSRSFEIASSTYTAVAYITNPNVGAGARGVHYRFRLYDDQNVLVREIEGTTDLPPIQTIPVFASNINVGQRKVVRTFFEFTDQNIPWVTTSAASVSQLHALPPIPNSDYSRVSTTISNNDIADAKNVKVVAVIFDASDTARAASQSIVGRVAAKSSQDVVFTWPGGVVDGARVQITVIPSF